MKNNKLLDVIKLTVNWELRSHGFEVRKILLFGSRARNEAREDSDWDIFVIVDKPISFATKRKVATEIRRKLVKAGITIDMIIQPELLVESQKDNVGYLTYYVLREGVEI